MDRIADGDLANPPSKRRPFLRVLLETKSVKSPKANTSPKREREYEELKEKFEHEGRYKGREKEVASRIVNKQRAQYGETREEKKKDREGKSPDRGLPIKEYQHKTIPEITSKLSTLSSGEVKQVKQYEQDHKNRKRLLAQLDRCLQNQPG